MTTLTQRLNNIQIETVRVLWMERYKVRPSYKWCQALLNLAISKDVAPSVIVSRFPRTNPIHNNNPYPYLVWLRSNKPEAREALTLKDGEESYRGWLSKLTVPYTDKGPSFVNNGPVSVEDLLSGFLLQG